MWAGGEVSRRENSPQNFGDQGSGVQGHGLARLQVDRDIVGALHMLDAPAQGVDIVVVPGDMVAAPEIDPLHAVHELPELVLHRGQGPGQGVGVLFAQGVEMQARNAVQVFLPKVLSPHAQAGAGRTRIVDGHGPFGVFRVDADAAFDGPIRIPDHVPKPVPLPEGVEHDMVADSGQFPHVRFAECRGKCVHFAPELFSAQSGLVGRTCAGSVQHLGQQGVDREHGKPFLGQENPAAGPFFD